MHTSFFAALVGVALIPVLQGQNSSAKPNPTKVALDVDRDGQLSSVEIAGAAKALASLDKNSDGRISREELGRSRRQRGGFRGGSRFGGSRSLGNALDTDGDGSLSETEIRNSPACLRRLDGNRDGKLSRRELDHVFQPIEGNGFGGMRGFGRRGGGVSEPTAPKDLKFKDGVAAIPDHAMFQKLSYQGPQVLIDTHLRNIEFVKFQIQKADTNAPDFYWINTQTHRSHPGFMSAVGISRGGRGGFGGGRGGTMRGVLCYRPLLKAPNGTPGLYTFEYEPNDAYPFDRIQLSLNLICKTAPFMKGKLAYYPLPRAMGIYQDEKAKYEAAKLPVFLAKDLYGDIAFLPLHKAESFGRLRLMKLDERPSPRDIVVYKTLPNEMPRVAGVITAARQTPLSHVNLRAIQDDVPNAFVLGATENREITSLLGKYVYYKVTHEGYELREASQAEVDAHFASARPRKPQVPRRNLEVKEARALSDIGFADWPAFGVKAANLAALHKLGLPPGVVPKGFAVPFHFYDEFMKHNGIYDEIRKIRARPKFASDADARAKALKRLRKKVRKGDFPNAIREALARVQASFPSGQSIRCRSSTNNEDLPQFSGAGLYGSFTHKPAEGHLAKSIKQVYASLWNFRAYEEREFYRIDHLQTAMGVLLHKNFDGELANGVAVTDDVVYQSENMFYMNTQVGEDLVTNPTADSIPEEMLLGPRSFRRDRIVQRSNRAKGDRPLLDEIQIEELRECLNTILKKYREFYGLSPRALFAMEVEFKVTATGQIAIKQARPWVY